MARTPELRLDDVVVIGPDQPDNARLGALVRRWRKDSGRTQEQVAREVGLTSGYVRMLEKGDRSPSAEALVGLLKVFGVRHLTEYRVGERVWDLIIMDADPRQTTYGVEFKGRMRSNRLDEVTAATALVRTLGDGLRRSEVYEAIAGMSAVGRALADGLTRSELEAMAGMSAVSRALGDPFRRAIEQTEQEAHMRRKDAQSEVIRRSVSVGEPLDDDDEQQRLEIRAPAERAQRRPVIHHVEASASEEANIPAEEADADLAKLTRFLGQADPKLVRRVIELLNTEAGIALQ